MLTRTQIKPLTEEEKKAKLDELRAKLAEKRAMQSKDDAKDQRANEVSFRNLDDKLTFSNSVARPDRTRARSKRTCRPRSWPRTWSARGKVGDNEQMMMRLRQERTTDIGRQARGPARPRCYQGAD
jgi:hypothetical protein